MNLGTTFTFRTRECRIQLKIKLFLKPHDTELMSDSVKKPHVKH